MKLERKDEKDELEKLKQEHDHLKSTVQRY
jgi:hypothetical protein